MSSMLFFGIKNHQTTPSSLQVPQKQRIKQIKHTKLLIDPQKIHLLYDIQQKTIVSKLILKNNYSFKINFKIIQPKKSILNVKVKKLTLNSKQTIEIFVFFNAEKQKIIIEDQFIIFLEKQKIKLHIPILCKPKRIRISQTKPSFLKRTSLYKNQNHSQTHSDLKILTRIQQKRTIIDLSSYLSTIIMNFMEKYNQIHEFVKQKNLKKQIFIGQKALTYEKHKKIVQFNSQIKQFIENTLKQKIQSRLVAEYSQQGPVVRNFQGLILRWHKQKNIPRMVYDKGLGKVQQQIRKYIVNLRFDKIHRIFALYRQFESSNQHSNLPLQKKHQIYVQKLQKKLNKKSQTNLQLIFDKNSIIPQYFDMQYEIYSQKRNNHQFEINPRIGFDNWVAIQQSVPYTHEIMNYSKKQPIPEWQCHPKLQENHKIIINNQHSHKNNHIKANYNNSLAYTQNYQSNNIQLDELFQSLSVFKVKSGSGNQNKMKKQTLLSSILANNINNVDNNNNERQKTLKPQQPQPLTFKSSSQQQQQRPSERSIMHWIVDNTIQRFKQTQSKQQQARLRQQMILKQENQKINFNLNTIMLLGERKVKLIGYLQGNQCDEFKCEQMEEDDNQRFIIKKLSRAGYCMDYLRELTFSKHQFQSFKQKPNKYFLQSIYSFKNSIIRKLPKQDKYQFDRLDNKALRILDWIEENQKQQNNGKIKGEIEMEVPMKNKIKNYVNPVVYQKNMENIDNYKKNLIRKGQALQVYLYQTAKNKNHAFIMQ